MALDVDGFGVFRAMASAPDVFGAITAEVNKTARTLAVKQLKAKSSNIQNFRDVRRALSAEFELVLEGMKEAELKTLVRKFDKHHPELKLADARWCLRHLSALASGSRQPLEKPKSPKRKTEQRSRPLKERQERLSSRAMGAVRKRVTTRR
jgi:hypothetical protein